uniref:Uncharacterized protein n=1 Tax=Tanacetum cinerariifolium TaxID=118510 RepID=A0A6L2M4D7_TANCI|nr:hypothetical protein [Tanacetum cinerariifolium]
MSLLLAENVIVAGADNRPSMLDKTQYSSWASCMLLYVKGKENEKLIVDSVLNGPFKYGTVTEVGTTTIRDRRYDELTDAEKIHETCDIKATTLFDKACHKIFTICFFIIAVQTPGSGISILLAVGTPSTGSGNLYCQWELFPGNNGVERSMTLPLSLVKLPKVFFGEVDE